MKGNYYDIAVSDLYFAKVGIDAILKNEVGGYNNCAASCTQAVEKLLKHLFIAFNLPFEKRLSESHNLNSLLRELTKSFPELKMVVKECRFLNDFYIEARYPGDNFEWVDHDVALQCFDFANKIKNAVDSAINNPGNSQRLMDVLKNKYQQ